MMKISMNRLAVYTTCLCVAFMTAFATVYYHSSRLDGPTALQAHAQTAFGPGGGPGQLPPISAPAGQRRPSSLDGKLNTGRRDLTLTVRMAAVPALLRLFYCTMLRSVALFWSPEYGPITLILDEESQADHEFETKLRRQERSLNLEFDFRYEPMPAGLAKMPLDRGRTSNYNRQLWSFFHMDLFVSAPIIALTDTDAMFTAPVTPENIFTGDRLRVIGMDWVDANWIDDWAASTELLIGKKMVADFMVYFPCYIWRDTITNCRNHCLRHLKVNSIVEAAAVLHMNFTTVKVSPISVVMSYAYHFEYERYDWHLDIRNLNGYKKTRNLPLDMNLTSRDTTPDIHVTVHERYYNGDVLNVMKQAYCAAKRSADQLPAFCGEFQNATNFYLFQFQHYTGKRDRNHLDTWCGGAQKRAHCRSLISSHYENAAQYFRAGWYDLNLSRVYVVEKAARELDITCPKVFDDDAA